MSNIPNVEEFLEREYVHIEHEPGRFIHESDFKKSMLEFAALHVQAALKAASEKAFAKGDTCSLTTKNNNFFWTFGGSIGRVVMDTDSILNAYPLTNIK
jgi:hypothetical protein